MKKLAAITKTVCVNALVCSAAAILLTACGAGMSDPTKSQPSKFAGVMQVSATVAANGPDADPNSAAAADQAAASAAPAGAEQAAASGLPSPPAADQAVPGASGAEQATASAAPVTPASTGVVPASVDAQPASTAGAPATAAAQGADSFAMVGYGASPAGAQAPATEGPVWPDPQDSVSSAVRR